VRARFRMKSSGRRAKTPLKWDAFTLGRLIMSQGCGASASAEPGAGSQGVGVARSFPGSDGHLHQRLSAFP
jgi:hypothetical protein